MCVLKSNEVECVRELCSAVCGRHAAPEEGGAEGTGPTDPPSHGSDEPGRENHESAGAPDKIHFLFAEHACGIMNCIKITLAWLQLSMLNCFFSFRRRVSQTVGGSQIK